MSRSLGGLGVFEVIVTLLAALTRVALAPGSVARVHVSDGSAACVVMRHARSCWVVGDKRCQDSGRLFHQHVRAEQIAKRMSRANRASGLRRFPGRS
jgi:hypothetical protein